MTSRRERPPGERRLMTGLRIGPLAAVLAVAAAIALAGPRPTCGVAAPQATHGAGAKKPAKAAKAAIYQSEAKPPSAKHPKHVVKVWLTTHKGRTFRVIQLPRCEHMEAVLSYEPSGETKEQAKERFGGVAVCTGSFHNSRTMALADFLQRNGSIVSGASTGRWFFAVLENGDLDISGNYMLVKGKSDVSALALGQRLVPLHRDGFSKAFMNQVTDRMALGLSHDYIFIVQGKSDIWRLADFMDQKLPCKIAINSDGGHVVRGKAPVHIIFRWREAAPRSAPSPAQQARDIATPRHSS